MTRERIEKLIPLIPQGTPMFEAVSGTWQEFRDVAPQSRAILRNDSRLLMDPAFAWKFAMAFKLQNRLIPGAPETEGDIAIRELVWLQHVNNFQRGIYESDNVLHRHIRAAVGLTNDKRKLSRAAVDGLLLFTDQTYEAIGKRLDVPGEAIRMYEQLFWNVRDRWAEKSYISALAFPDGRKPELMSDYLYATDDRALILRASMEGELLHMLRFAGIIEADQKRPSAEESSRRYEEKVMFAAVSEQALGGGHGLYPASASARQIIQSVNMSGAEKKNTHDAELSEMSLLFPIMKTLKQLTSPGVKKMLAFEQMADGSNLKNLGEKGKPKEKGEKPDKPGMGKPVADWQKW